LSRTISYFLRHSSFPFLTSANFASHPCLTFLHLV
jgi:hypothetical protein